MRQALQERAETDQLPIALTPREARGQVLLFGHALEIEGFDRQLLVLPTELLHRGRVPGRLGTLQMPREGTPFVPQLARACGPGRQDGQRRLAAGSGGRQGFDLREQTQEPTLPGLYPSCTTRIKARWERALLPEVPESGLAAL